MIIPDKIKICGIEYSVKIVRFQETDSWGIHNLYDQEILLNDKNNDVINGITFFHEILHAINAALESKLDEQQVESISRAYYQVLNNNGLLKED